MADKVFTMRIDEELLEKIRSQAESNKRSVAKEIEYILESHFKFSEPPNDEDLLSSEEVNVLAHRIIELLNKSGKKGLKIEAPNSGNQ